METRIFAWMMDIFFIFTLHILYRQLLGVKYKSKLPLLLGWGGCFLLWNASSYLFVGNALVCNVCTSIICFLTLCLLYNGNAGTKIVLAVLVVALGMIAEGITVFLLKISGRFMGESYSGEYVFRHMANALSKLMCFVFVKIITVISARQPQVKIGIAEWTEIFLAPVGSIIICYAVWWDAHNRIDFARIVVLGVLLVINLATYYLYQKMQTHAMERMENELIKQQNKYFRLRYEEFEKQWLKLRRIRHDMANSCVLEMGYLEKEQYGQLLAHYQERLGQIKRQGDVIDTGNIGIDSILNYKLELAREGGIQVEKEIKITGEVAISNMELNILIGNLFDNAMEAVRELAPEKRKIRFSIKTNVTGFLFEIANPYEGKRIQNRENRFLTTKEDRIYHGLGLREVEEIVKKYDGKMTIQSTDGEFCVKIFTYMYDES